MFRNAYFIEICETAAAPEAGSICCEVDYVAKNGTKRSVKTNTRKVTREAVDCGRLSQQERLLLPHARMSTLHVAGPAYDMII